MTLEHINQELQTLKEKKELPLSTPHPRRAECNSERTTNVEPIFQ